MAIATAFVPETKTITCPSCGVEVGCVFNLDNRWWQISPHSDTQREGTRKVCWDTWAPIFRNHITKNLPKGD